MKNFAVGAGDPEHRMLQALSVHVNKLQPL
jgi:hypothetical protein